MTAYGNKDYKKVYDLAMSISEDPTAQYYLGYLYEKGYGVNKDYAKALKWYRKAADKSEDLAKDRIKELEKKGYK